MHPFTRHPAPADPPLGGAPGVEADCGGAADERRAAWRYPLLVVGGICLLAAIVLLKDPIARTVVGQSNEESLAIEGLDFPDEPFDPGVPYTISSLDIHPDDRFAGYFGGVFSRGEPGATDLSDVNRDVRWRLEMYERTYGVDDNFTIRVYDGRTGEMLEAYTLRNLKAIYDSTGEIDWEEVDFPNRRTHSTRLRAKWQARGIPREDIVLRWGRANQSLESRERDEPFIQYEINLSRRLGLSLLATEIGTVETFNQDHLVSSAGARSRYQLMPDNLRRFEVARYRVPTTAGGYVQVREENHPLLAMEPSMMIVRAYSNAVGHELPGISAYHTGPGNIFRLYQAYLRAHAANPPLNGHVSDAYVWGVTDGFERVRAQSSFGPQSRAYVMKAYGALRATEDKLIDPAKTMRVDRVEIRPGEAISLERILSTIGEIQGLHWGVDVEGLSPYEKFRRLNPHMELPHDARGGVPADGNVRFTSIADGHPVRFFLPSGAVDLLRRVGYDVFANVFRFDDNTFLVDNDERTGVDRQYERLVEDTGRFGFTMEAKRELDDIVNRLDRLVASNPTHFRQSQARIARMHRSIWNTSAFQDLAGTAETLLSFVPDRRALQRELAIADSLAAVSHTDS